MKQYISEDFLLSNSTAKKLYFEVLRDVPVFDYHCHISAKKVYENKIFSDISELWLKDDHYKWRAMRNCGIQEKYITGDKTSNYEKFKAWAKVLPLCIGNVIYTWSQLELTRSFGINEILDEKTSDKLWNQINDMLLENEYTPRSLLKRANVAFLNTTDDPLDSLVYHEYLLNDNSFTIKILPTWRPDKILDIEQKEYDAYVSELGKISSIKIDSFDALKKALKVRMDYFADKGCVSADHSLKYIPFRQVSDSCLEEIFNKRMSGDAVSMDEEDSYKTELMTYFAREYSQRGWIMQLHIGAMRNNNRRMYEKLGPNSGFDSINDLQIATFLSKFMDRLDYIDELPRTIIFALNPKDYYVIGSIIGNYQTDEIPGKIQFGAAWWFNDHIDGIRKQIKDLANIDVLSNCIGMVTDSRCFLTLFSRPELYRRILCDVLGKWVESGLYPKDMERLIGIVRDISFNNAKVYFGQ